MNVTNKKAEVPGHYMTAEEFDSRMQSREIAMTSYRLPPDRDEPIQVWGHFLNDQKSRSFYAELPNTDNYRAKFDHTLMGGKFPSSFRILFKY